MRKETQIKKKLTFDLWSMRSIFTLIILISALALNAQTSISAGEVSGTWIKANSPYQINGNINVHKDSTLKIGPGVRVEFQGKYKLVVNGHINCEGTASDKITFTAANKADGWEGMEVLKNTSRTDSLIFDYCVFEYAKYYALSAPYHGAVYVGESINTRISNSLFYRNKSNVGGGLFISKNNNALVYETDFVENEVTSHNFGFVTPDSIVHGSALFSIENNLEIKFCHFKKNSIYSMDTEDSIKGMGKGVLYFDEGFPGAGSFKISNCKFSENFASGIAGINVRVAKSDFFLSITNIEFVKNHIKNGSLLYIDDKSTSNSTINNLIFKDNYCGSQVCGCASIIPATDTKISNVIITGHDGYGAGGGNNIRNYFVAGNTSTIAVSLGNGGVNSNIISVNNKRGLEASEYSNTTILNSLIAFNGSDTKYEHFGLNSGLVLNSSSNITLNNTIIQNNRNGNRHQNVYSDGPKVLTEVRNNIIEHGFDSMFHFDGTQLSARINLDNINGRVEFVKPPLGVGPDFYDSTSDWHIKTNCKTPITKDAGTHLWLLLAGINEDFDGNARIKNGIVDIGPYEMQGPIIPNFTMEGRDTAFCADKEILDSLFASTVDGIDLTYQWQNSSNGNSWMNTAGQTESILINHNIPLQSSYYRLIAKYSVCNKYDTSKTLLLTVNQLPKPNLGIDRSMKYEDFETLDPGSFSKYTWFTGAKSSTLKADNNNLDTGKNTIWVSVVDDKGCVGKDTVIITLEPVNGLNDPRTLGWSIYPNPAQDFIHIKGPKGNYQWRIVDFSGKEVLNGENNTKLDLDSFKPGQYIFHLRNGQGNYGLRLIKQ